MKATAVCTVTCIAALSCAALADDESKTLAQQTAAPETTEHQTPQPKTPQQVELVFASLDRNDDQRISKEEALREKSVANRFESIDASGDGYLSKAEFRARPSAESFE